MFAIGDRVRFARVLTVKSVDDAAGICNVADESGKVYTMRMAVLEKVKPFTPTTDYVKPLSLLSFPLRRIEWENPLVMEVGALHKFDMKTRSELFSTTKPFGW